MSLLGLWTGTTKTWLASGAAPEETAISASITAILGGRWLCIDYQGGHLIVGNHDDAREHEISRIEGTSVTRSLGKMHVQDEELVIEMAAVETRLRRS